MKHNDWTDRLHDRLSDYKAVPPVGLWDKIETAVDGDVVVHDDLRDLDIVHLGQEKEGADGPHARVGCGGCCSPAADKRCGISA